MTSRVSWSVEGIDPSVRDQAEAAARRAGMPLGDWMNLMISGSAARAAETANVAAIHNRLDSISQQVDQMSAGRPSPRNEPGVAQRLNDAISRLDARLSQMPAQASQPAPPHERIPAPRPPAGQNEATPAFSIAEIVARQGELDGSRRPSPSVDLSGLEQQLSKITSQIETLRGSESIDQAIASFREELAAIRFAITEAMPRRAIESLEGEVRSLSQRINDTRQSGTDTATLGQIEGALSEIRAELRSLTPAENLIGFDEAIRNLNSKIDMIVRSSADNGGVHQIEEAISALRTIVANVASNEALSELSGHVQSIAAKIDQLAPSDDYNPSFAALEQRIAVLTSALESRDRAPAGDTSYFDSAVQTISNRLDNLQVGTDSSSTFSHLEQRIHHLLERLETVGNHDSQFGRVEQGLSEVLRNLEEHRQQTTEMAARAVAQADPEVINAIKRELSDLRFNQSENDRHTQDSFEAVHSSLGHVVDRLGHIERDLRNKPANADSAARETVAAAAPMPSAFVNHSLPRTSSPPLQPRPELPNPAVMQDLPRTAPRASAEMQPATEPSAPLAMRDISIPAAEISEKAASAPLQPAREPLDPSLPPDHPLEPGTKLQQGRATPSERIAASEAALAEITPAPRGPVNTSNFIQAARRAAQAAAQPTTPEKPNRVTALSSAARSAAQTTSSSGSTLSSKIRALLVAASVVVIVLGTVKMAMNLLEGRDAGSPPGAATSDAPSPALPLAPPADREDSKPVNPPPAPPSMTSPTPMDRQSLNSAPPAPTTPPPSAETTTAPDITGSVAQPDTAVPVDGRQPATVFTDTLPDAIGSAPLRSAALQGNAAAAYEIGLRYADGRGVAANYEEAAKWYERAVQGDIVPAMFRLGTLHEKGLGAKKDLDLARRYYLQAAERGSAKAMHNLAVLEADGGSRGPNYNSAAQWFRKAAERGIADSQFNLAILYARGIGVDQNLAESFKWFSLAAAQGDADAGRKRDDVAKRLDPQSLAAAKLAIQTFVPESQPNDAVNVAAPAGGWDGTAAKKTATKPMKAKSAAR